MLKRVEPLHDPAAELSRGLVEDQGLSIKDIVAFLRRRAWTIAAPLFVALAVAIWYLLTSQPLYTARADLMLETQRQQLLQQQPFASDVSLDTAFVGSQIEVLRSEGLLRSVVQNLRLTEDPQFVDRSTGIFSPIRKLFSADEELSKMDMAVLRLSNGLSVQRVGQTYVIEITYVSPDPDTASRIANAVAESYILDGLNSRQANAQRTAAWMRNRVDELREEAISADRAVIDFKAAKGITDVGGQSILEQQLAELSKQLMVAQAQTAEAKAKMDEVSAAGLNGVRVTDSPGGDIIARLRQQYSEFARREAAIQSRVDALTSGLVSTKQTQAALRILESSAQTYHTVHSSFLQRLVERAQQQSFPSSEARVLTPAVRAEKNPSTRTLIAASVLGLALGFGFAIAREVLTPTLRTPKQVEQAIGIECLGVLPTLNIKQKKKPQPGNKDTYAGRLVPKELGLLRSAILDPFSRFADTMRKLQSTAEFGSGSCPAKVIGIISAMPAEGKTTVSANLAQLLAKGGRRTLLIDGDLHDRTLSQWMAPAAEAGIMQVITDSIHLDDIVWRDPLTGLEFLPAFLRESIADTSQVLSSEGMTRLIKGAEEAYEYVVIDFPQMAAVVDAKAAAHLVDAFILVIQWDETSPDVLREVLSSAEIVQSKTVGAVLNRADSYTLRTL
jgi:polysaccharide biosynthesis transport protein